MGIEIEQKGTPTKLTRYAVSRWRPRFKCCYRRRTKSYHNLHRKFASGRPQASFCRLRFLTSQPSVESVSAAARSHANVRVHLFLPSATYMAHFAGRACLPTCATDFLARAQGACSRGARYLQLKRPQPAPLQGGAVTRAARRSGRRELPKRMPRADHARCNRRKRPTGRGRELTRGPRPRCA
jgi:hypothetical protein